MKKTITLVCLGGGSPRTNFFRRTPSNKLIFSFFQKTILAAGLLFFGQQMQAQFCTMACDNLVQVSLPATCEGEITPSMILSGSYTGANCSPNGPGAFVVTVMNNLNNPIPTSPIVTTAEVGQYWTVKVKHWASGNSCWGSIFVEDKLAPDLDCPPSVTVECTESTSIAATGSATATDCSDFTIDSYDITSGGGCGSIAGTITRTWTASDEHGHTSSCLQTITVAQPSTNDILWPPNRDGFAAPALDCTDPITIPDNTGYPTISGQPIPNGVGYCSMAVDFNDQVLPLCEGSYKILRHWTIVYWCTGAILNHTQIIAVKDTHAPTLTCPPSLNVGTTSSQFCQASIILPQIGITDDCGTTFNVTMNTPAGWVSGNGGIIHNVNVGGYTVTYNVTDDCGNAAACYVPITVADDDAPTVVCDEFTVVTLNSGGMAIVNAATFDDGSYDNCGPVSFKVRRMSAGCGEQPIFAPTVKFCCADVGDDVPVEMQVTDYIGNSNSCMVTVHVDDNSEPLILCPGPVTLTCLQDPTDLNLTGEPTTDIACGTVDATYSDAENLNQCNGGNIIRTWTAGAGNGSSNSCTQTITLVDNTPVSVTWPDDYQATACASIASLAPDSLPAGFDFPIVTKDCELIATNVSDQLFTVAAPACFKIVRTWTLMDWCNSQNVFTHEQIVMVYDDEAPTFTCPTNFTVGVDANCVGVVTLPQVTDIQDCSEDVTVFVSSTLGNGYGPFVNVGPGIYTANYIVADGCNNSSNCSITIEVKDDKDPTPYCKNGLIVELMGVDTDGNGTIDNGMAETWASDFDDGSSDNCPGAVKFSFSTDVNDTGIQFDCDDLGQQPIQMWVTDVAGNQDFCETFIVVQDNMGVCSGDDPLVASIGGAIATEMGESVEEVMVSVNVGNMPPAMTGADGNFIVSGVPLGGDFTVNPGLNNEMLNGVTTYDLVLIKKHILNIAPLASPYKLIAADVNHTETVTTADLVAIQKVILQITDVFPNNQSWRFVDAGYVFPNPQNPFEENFPEVYNVNNFAGNMSAVNFTAVKIGDVNNSAAPNLMGDDVEERSMGTLALRANDQVFAAGETLTVDVTAENFMEIVGYQFTLNFDDNKLRFVGALPGELPQLTAANFGHALLDRGALTTSWHDFQPVSLPEGAVLFRLVFAGRQNGNLGEALHLTSDFTKAEAYQNDGERLDVELDFAPSAVQRPPSTVSVIPNPFTTSTTIVFVLETAQPAELTIFGTSGRVVVQRRSVFAEGAAQFQLSAEELPGAGTYFYRLKTEEGVMTGKILRR